MYKGLILAMAMVSCFTLAPAEEYDPSFFSSDGLKLQPAPAGHVPGKDNGPGQGTHNTGEDCGLCHRPDGKASSKIFTMSGTLYEDRAGRRPLKGGEVILQDITGHVISMTSNESGNFWTYAPIVSNPYAVASHSGMTHPLYHEDEMGFHPADPEDARSWQYKAWVKYEDHVRPMVTIAPVGNATDPNSRMSCSMHHSNMGNRGALWGAGKSTLRSYPQAHLSFKKHILPIFRSKCAPCHIPGATWTRIVTRSDFEYDPPTVIDHSSLLDLTSYAGSSVTAGDSTWVKRGIKDITSGYRKNPDASPVLSKTRRYKNGGVLHAGGAFWTVSDADYKAIRRWIAEGAQDN